MPTLICINLKVAITQWQFLIGFDCKERLIETSNVIKASEQIRDVDATHLAWHEEALQLGSKVGVGIVLITFKEQHNKFGMRSYLHILISSTLKYSLILLFTTSQSVRNDGRNNND